MDRITAAVRPARQPPATAPRPTLKERALALWPRLDRRSLTRCGSDPACIARVVARRTMLPPEVILEILGSGVTDADRELWFG